MENNEKIVLKEIETSEYVKVKDIFDKEYAALTAYNNQGVVFALYGDGGVGKSTLDRHLKEYLDEQEIPNARVEFNLDKIYNGSYPFFTFANRIVERLYKYDKKAFKKYIILSAIISKRTNEKVIDLGQNEKSVGRKLFNVSFNKIVSLIPVIKDIADFFDEDLLNDIASSLDPEINSDEFNEFIKRANSVDEHTIAGKYIYQEFRNALISFTSNSIKPLVLIMDNTELVSEITKDNTDRDLFFKLFTEIKNIFWIYSGRIEYKTKDPNYKLLSLNLKGFNEEDTKNFLLANDVEISDKQLARLHNSVNGNEIWIDAKVSIIKDLQTTFGSISNEEFETIVSEPEEDIIVRLLNDNFQILGSNETNTRLLYGFIPRASREIYEKLANNCGFNFIDANGKEWFLDVAENNDVTKVEYIVHNIVAVAMQNYLIAQLNDEDNKNYSLIGLKDKIKIALIYLLKENISGVSQVLARYLVTYYSEEECLSFIRELGNDENVDINIIKDVFNIFKQNIVNYSLYSFYYGYLKDVKRRINYKGIDLFAFSVEQQINYLFECVEKIKDDDKFDRYTEKNNPLYSIDYILENYQNKEFSFIKKKILENSKRLTDYTFYIINKIFRYDLQNDNNKRDLSYLITILKHQIIIQKEYSDDPTDVYYYLKLEYENILKDLYEDYKIEVLTYNYYDVLGILGEDIDRTIKKNIISDYKKLIEKSEKVNGENSVKHLSLLNSYLTLLRRLLYIQEAIKVAEEIIDKAMDNYILSNGPIKITPEETDIIHGIISDYCHTMRDYNVEKNIEKKFYNYCKSNKIRERFDAKIVKELINVFNNSSAINNRYYFEKTIELMNEKFKREDQRKEENKKAGKEDYNEIFNSRLNNIFTRDISLYEKALNTFPLNPDKDGYKVFVKNIRCVLKNCFDTKDDFEKFAKAEYEKIIFFWESIFGLTEKVKKENKTKYIYDTYWKIASGKSQYENTKLKDDKIYQRERDIERCNLKYISYMYTYNDDELNDIINNQINDELNLEYFNGDSARKVGCLYTTMTIWDSIKTCLNNFEGFSYKSKLFTSIDYISNIAWQQTSYEYVKNDSENLCLYYKNKRIESNKYYILNHAKTVENNYETLHKFYNVDKSRYYKSILTSLFNKYDLENDKTINKYLNHIILDICYHLDNKISFNLLKEIYIETLNIKIKANIAKIYRMLSILHKSVGLSIRFINEQIIEEKNAILKANLLKQGAKMLHRDKKDLEAKQNYLDAIDLLKVAKELDINDLVDLYEELVPYFTNLDEGIRYYSNQQKEIEGLKIDNEHKYINTKLQSIINNYFALMD